MGVNDIINNNQVWFLPIISTDCNNFSTQLKIAGHVGFLKNKQIH